MILSCSHINKSFGTDTILSDVSFHINEKEKAAIVGINGSGKSTLLKIIMGEISAEGGEVVIAKGYNIGYLSQQQDLISHNSIYEEMLDAKKEILELDCRIRSLEKEMKTANEKELEQKLKIYTRLTHEFEIKKGYALQSEIKGVLKGLGFQESEFDRPITNLSGGQKTRIALGKLLLTNPDMLLLDEPTNHLDMDSISWLESYLHNYKKTVLIVAHDRYFLDKVASKIIEIDHTHCCMFQGNYSDYAQKKAKQREIHLKQYYNQQHEIRHQEEVIAKLRSFNREKSIKRAESREKLLNKIERVEKPVNDDTVMRVRFDPQVISGKDVLSVKGLSKSFGEHVLFADINFEIKRGERIAIIGNNGTGKTTILKIINHLTNAAYEEMKFGSKVKVAYYDQEHQNLHPEKTLFEELQDTYPQMDHTSIRNVLASFLFTGDHVYKRIKDVSGGEKGRISLTKLMLSDANLLILDEPTNHLDIVSKEILEQALTHYSGTVLYVSHDRYFINKTATGILHLTQGHLLKYIGNYDYFLEKKEETEQAYIQSGSEQCQSKPTHAYQKSETKADWKQKKEDQAKIRKLQNDLSKVEQTIHDLEVENEDIDSLIMQPDIASDAVKLMEYTKRKEEIEILIEDFLTEWEHLSEAITE